MNSKSFLTNLSCAALISLFSPIYSSFADELHVEFQRQVAPQSTAVGWERLGTMTKSSELIGLTLRDRNKIRLGKIREVIVNISTGRAVAALVESAASSSRNDLAVVPAGSFMNVSKREASLTCDRLAFAGAASISQKENSSAALAKAINISLAYFNDGKTASLGESGLAKAGDIIGLEVRNKAGDKLGLISNLMIDLPGNRVFYALISRDGTDKNVFATPPSALIQASAGTGFTLDADSEKINQTASTQSFFWVDLYSAAWASKTYQLYNQSDVIAPLDNTRLNVRSQAGSESDAAADSANNELTRNILVALVAHDRQNGLSHTQLKINASGGKVILSGEATKDSEKLQLGIDAESVAGKGNVENQITVRR